MSNLPDKFLKPYDPASTEKNIYSIWEKSGLFNPDVSIEKGFTAPDAETFSIVLPPPNVTGVLHMGHASMLTIEDIMVRYNRMLGKRTLWLPGTDHAAIATQSVVEKQLSKEGIRRTDLGREKFLEKVNQFAQESHDTITTQIRSMGASVDWSREAFTLDKARERAVRTAFKKMYEDGLIYQGHRIVNWDPKGQTTISDDEVTYQEEKTSFYYLKYGPFTIGTSRPETKFGDKYVVMHPDDSRYAEYTDGQKIELEWINGPITATIIKDSAIDMEFGTGVMTITPWHDHTDFEIAERHKLSYEQIIDSYGKLLPIAGEFAGMKITEARAKIIEKLQSKGLIEKIEENYIHNVATAERSGGTVEPQIMKQWFINVNKKFKVENSKLTGISDGQEVTLKELMQNSVASGQINILPERFERVYYNWINNLRDWCISRQIWYGHQIPVWYKGNNPETQEIFVGLEAPEGEGWIQDPDTLDTWFSSGLWTFSTLGWPEQTEDFKNYHPTNVLETGTDIIFFWVARMILMSGYLLNEVPFKTVYLQGLVRDKQGRKLSKSLGNGGDPIEMTDQFGADAVRMALIVGVGPGNDLNLSEDKIRAYKKFSNKIWNASRFVLENTADYVDRDAKNLESISLNEQDEKILVGYKLFLSDITDDMENFRYYLASEKAYHYFWHTFADIILEESKPILGLGKEFEGVTVDEAKKLSRQKLIYTLLVNNLKMLHPFMPFVTEEIWQSLPIKDSELLMVSKWN